ncbi:unnamed protein product [Euphydryas editha]|uniref:Uncharacterized protein n=1 Tax=Euphydryas editha TaxID=104508 RepID=A0AAU9USY3_EUPED|nr:unnamed protein product [Euphydryas editha]
MPNNIIKDNNVEDLLDSDDELPMEYNDISIKPAYEIDNRFDIIQFKWIKNIKICNNGVHDNTEKNSANTSEVEIPLINTKNNFHLKLVVQRGVMNKHDLFCLKSIKDFTGDSTLIWLINFLLHKDLQSEYAFLKSCLVVSTMCN